MYRYQTKNWLQKQQMIEEEERNKAKQTKQGGPIDSDEYDKLKKQYEITNSSVPKLLNPTPYHLEQTLKSPTTPFATDSSFTQHPSLVSTTSIGDDRKSVLKKGRKQSTDSMFSSDLDFEPIDDQDQDFDQEQDLEDLEDLDLEAESEPQSIQTYSPNSEDMSMNFLNFEGLATNGQQQQQIFNPSQQQLLQEVKMDLQNQVYGFEFANPSESEQNKPLLQQQQQQQNFGQESNQLSGNMTFENVSSAFSAFNPTQTQNQASIYNFNSSTMTPNSNLGMNPSFNMNSNVNLSMNPNMGVNPNPSLFAFGNSNQLTSSFDLVSSGIQQQQQQQHGTTPTTTTSSSTPFLKTQITFNPNSSITKFRVSSKPQIKSEPEPKAEEIVNEKLRKRRESHNAVERRRRDQINERITELSFLVPDCLDANGVTKPNKGFILRKSADYIRYLQEVNRKLEQVVQQQQQILQSNGSST